MARPSTIASADVLSWTILCGMAAACLALGYAMGFGVRLDRAILPGLGIALLVAGVVIGHRTGRKRLVVGATAFLQMTVFTILGVVLAYLLAAGAGQSWDAALAAADARLGLDWPAILRATDALPAPLLLLGGVAYHSLVLQMVGCIVLLAATGRADRLRATVAAAVLAGAVTIALSGWIPATGNLFDPDRYAALWPSVAWLDRDLVAGLRDGTVRRLDLSHMTGIVSFPSYHAALPVLLAWSVYPLRRVGPAAAGWAGATIVATPVFGGHYAVDVLAGLVVAIGALAVSRGLASAPRASAGMPPHRPCGTREPRPAPLPHVGSEARAGVMHELA